MTKNLTLYTGNVMKALTYKEIERQDFVDNAISNLLHYLTRQIRQLVGI